MLLKGGLLLGFAAVFLQIAVFLQPLLPKQFQIAPICETITHALKLSSTQYQHNLAYSGMSHAHQHDLMPETTQHEEHGHHDLNHQCQYCTVYGNLILPPEPEVKEVLVRIQIRLLAFRQALRHIYFELQRLFLLPQGRAPPVYA